MALNLIQQGFWLTAQARVTNLKQKKKEKKENLDWWSNLAPIQVNETLSFKHDQAPFVLYTKYIGLSIFVQGAYLKESEI